MYWLKQHVRVTIALIIRETSARYGNKPGGYVWAILDPLAHVAMMSYFYQIIARTPALGTDFPLFFATGYLPFSAYQGMSAFVAGAVRSNKNLFSYPIVAPIDAVAGRYILQLITSALVTMVIFSICTSEVSHLHSADMGIVVASFVLATLLGLGIGLVNIPMFNDYPLYEKIFTLVNRPLLLISGVFFLPDAMPKPVQSVLLWNPLVHAIMWFRAGIYPEYNAAGLDMQYLIMSTAVIVMVGLTMFTFSRSLREDRI